MNEGGRTDRFDRAALLSGISSKGKKGTNGDPELSNLPSRRKLMSLQKIIRLPVGVSVRSPMNHSGDRYNV